MKRLNQIGSNKMKRPLSTTYLKRNNKKRRRSVELNLNARVRPRAVPAFYKLIKQLTLMIKSKARLKWSSGNLMPPL